MLITQVSKRPTDLSIALGLLFAVLLWGGNNTGTKVVVSSWPPVWTGASRFVCAGALLWVILRYTRWLGQLTAIDSGERWRLWSRGGLSLATYIVVFNWALHLTAASHVALYLGAAPVWALLWEGVPRRNIESLRRYGAALVALTGVAVLFAPAVKGTAFDWRGEVLGLAASLLWTNYGRQCRALGARLSGAQVSAHTMYSAGVLLLPFGCMEVACSGLRLNANLLAIQTYCITAGGVVAFAIWSNALRYWSTSKVLLFNNLIPISTASWAFLWLREPLTTSFWAAMALIIGGVVLGQANWQKFIAPRAVPPE